MTLADVQGEIDLGYFRPSLIKELCDAAALEGFDPERAKRLEASDRAADYVKHKAVYEASRRRKQAIREYEEAAKKVAAQGTSPEKPQGVLGKILTALRPIRANMPARSKRSA
jgi:hypothetical protein